MTNYDERLNKIFPIEALVLQSWLEGVKNRDAAALVSLFSTNPILNPPFQDETVEGANNILKTLRAFDQSVNNFKYQRTFVQEGTALLEFTGDVGGQALQGLDLFNINKAGEIESIEVMARPLAAVQKLGEAIALSLD